MNSIHEIKNEVITQILHTIKHPYLNQHLSIPTIDDVKVTLLINLLKDNDFTSDKIVHYCKALMIHQIALDTHEKVSTYESTPMDREKKQLTVLEGDLYSGLYYNALSKTGEIGLIKELSYAVKEMNEEKINLVHEKFKSLDELFKCITVIESTIIVHFAKFIASEESIHHIEQACLIARLKKEYEISSVDHCSDFIKQFQNIIGMNDMGKIKEEISKIMIQLQK
ncbi:MULTISPECIES: heptaprenyl diphosphate synthase component 1 [unclassified Bacillus (in: firmicutes)]|uniref:heptaprenyl diphosphate synthase component 1 n=1 Tax=unclassified Bacillus (in: firmicutes) TaxID=185979 RepID=UPI0015CF2625|nr:MULTISPECIES: heptaprenyl diphosphate synthase component 1 [unclassified Bacillus (in: firmicutes)]